MLLESSVNLICLQTLTRLSLIKSELETLHGRHTLNFKKIATMRELKRY